MAITTSTALALAAFGSAASQAHEQRKGRKAASKANQQAIEQEKSIFDILREDAQRNYDQQREDQAPFRELSLNALNQLQDFNKNPYSVLNTPEAQDLQKYITRGVENSAAARGRLNSYDTLQNVAQSSINQAAIPLSNTRFNQLSTAAGFGNIPSAQINNTSAANVGNNIADLIGNQGTIQAQGAANNAKLYSDTINNLLTAYQLYGGKK